MNVVGNNIPREKFFCQPFIGFMLLQIASGEHGSGALAFSNDLA
jgi:hypothetical protein